MALKQIQDSTMTILAIDQGTTSTRALVIEDSGAFRIVKSIEHQQFYPKPGWVEHDPEELIQNIRVCIESCDELLAIEERLLPGYVVKRYSKKDLESKTISFDLVNQYPDTTPDRFNYKFVSQPLSEKECQLTELSQGINFLRRIGEYYNSMDERFMLGRLTVISDRINLRYDYTKREEKWILWD